MKKVDAADGQPGVQNVRMGELFAGGADCAFRSLLGSCIGLVLFDVDAVVGGMAHVMLPSSAGHTGPPGKFADTAITELVRRIEGLGGRRERLKAKIAGGARMFDSAAATTIGNQNQASVESGLNDFNISVVGSDCGGANGRRMMFFVANGHVIVEAVGKDSIEI